MKRILKRCFSVLSGLLLHAGLWAQAPIGWTLLHDKTIVEWEGVPASIVEKLKGMTERKSVDMHYIAFTHNARGWIMAYHSGTPGAGASYNKSWEEVPKDLVEQAEGLNQKDVHIRQFAFFQSDGWLILYGDNQALWKNVPAGLGAQITALHQSNRKIVHIATHRDGGWVLLADNNEFFSENIPADMLEKLQELQKKGVKIQQVAFHANDGWLILYNDNQAIWKNIPESLGKRISELHQSNTVIESISFWSLPAQNKI